MQWTLRCAVAVHYTRLGTGLTTVSEDEALPEEQHMLTEYGACKVRTSHSEFSLASHVPEVWPRHASKPCNAMAPRTRTCSDWACMLQHSFIFGL